MDNRLVLKRSLWVTLITLLSMQIVLNHWSFSRDAKINSHLVGVFSGFVSQGRIEAKQKRIANFILLSVGSIPKSLVIKTAEYFSDAVCLSLTWDAKNSQCVWKGDMSLGLFYGVKKVLPFFCVCGTRRWGNQVKGTQAHRGIFKAWFGGRLALCLSAS